MIAIKNVCVSVCKCGKECMQVFGGNISGNISVCKCGKECKYLGNISVW